MRKVRVTVPATTANLGPGFDSLALALGLHNVVELGEADEGLQIHLRGEGADSLPRDTTNMVYRGAQAVFKAAGLAPSGLLIRIESDIPVSSGLGSSAAALLGGIVAANAIVNNPLKRNDLLKIASDIEGHPDNVIAALLGGLIVSSYDGETLVYKSVSIEPMQSVVVLPDVDLSTKAAREALPDKVSLADAAQNVGRAALVVQALVGGDYDLLGKAMRDRLHEPYRRKLIPGYEEVSKAAHDAGAAAVAISGAGPALVAFAASGHDRVGKAMVRAFKQAAGKAARMWVLPIDTQGISISEMATEMPLSSVAPEVKAANAVPSSAPGEIKTKGQSESVTPSKPVAKTKPQAAGPQESTTASAQDVRPEAAPATTKPQAKPVEPASPAKKVEADKASESQPAGRALKLGEAADLIRRTAESDEKESELATRPDNPKPGTDEPKENPRT